MEACARRERFEVIYAGKAFPATAAFRLFAEEGLSADVARAARATTRWREGRPARSTCTATAGFGPSSTTRWGRIGGHRHRLVRRGRAAARRRARAMLRVTPGITPATHSYIQTGQEDSKFGLGIDEVPRAVEACGEADIELHGLHAQSGRSCSSSRASSGSPRCCRDGRLAAAEPGGGLGIAYTAEYRPRRSRSTWTRCCTAPRPTRPCCASRPLAGRECRRDDLHGWHRQRIPGVRTYVSSDGGCPTI